MTEIPENMVLFGLEERPHCGTIALFPTRETARHEADISSMEFGWRIVRWVATREPDGIVRLVRDEIVEDRWKGAP